MISVGHLTRELQKNLSKKFYKYSFEQTNRKLSVKSTVTSLQLFLYQRWHCVTFVTIGNSYIDASEPGFRRTPKFRTNLQNSDSD